MLMKAVEYFVMGFFFVLGWDVGNNVIALIGQFFHR